MAKVRIKCVGQPCPESVGIPGRKAALAVDKDGTFEVDSKELEHFKNEKLFVVAAKQSASSK